MNKEIGGYFELDTFNLPMLHDNGLKLNCGRNALAYLIEANDIKRLCIPYFMCDSVINTCNKYDVEIIRYHINYDFTPILNKINTNEWIYVVNYYGQLDDEIQELIKKYNNIIVDNAQSYFSKPIDNINTLYTCRKYFGVSDGAILFTNNMINRKLEIDYSYDRIRFVLGRYEASASDFFRLASDNNEFFDKEDIKKMSKLTNNLLHAIDYNYVRDKRTENYNYLNLNLSQLNKLKLKKIEGAYMYPFYADKAQLIKKKMLENKVYIPTLWPNVMDEVEEETLEYKFSKNILPLPCDQRYKKSDMDIIIKIIKENI